MKSFLTSASFYLLCVAAISLLLLPFHTPAQNKQVSLAGNGYHNLNKGDYMRSWMLAGPVKMNKKDAGNPTVTDQEKFFNEEVFSLAAFTPAAPVPLPETSDRKLNWKAYVSATDQIDLDSVYNKADFVAAYALAEIQADSSYPAFLAVSSDDAIKVWHNGKQVHKNWIARPLNPDEDLVPLTLQKGRNTLLIKVYDMGGGWGFTSRFLGKEKLSDHLVSSARKGDVDAVELLLTAGASIENKNSSGLTALQSAEVYGREEVVKLLLSKGAKKESLPPVAVLIDDMYKKAGHTASPGIALLVTQNGKPVYNKAFGYAEIENKSLITPDTKFRIGSITKQFTAAAILKLQEEGKLKVTDKLTKFYPEFPGGDDVTLHHLLTHTSGIHSYTGKPDFISRVNKPISADSLISYFRNDPYDFKPGEEFRYNNSGYFLLGNIIEKVSGKSYEAYLKEKFFDPLDMRHTGIHTSSLKLDSEAKGYAKPGTDFQRANDWDMSWAGGAGALYSTTGDLSKWNEAVFAGKVLNAESMKSAFTPVVLNNGKVPSSGEYGYGWFIGKYRGKKVIQHSGGLEGFVSQLAYYPEEKFTVIMLTNVTPPQVNVSPASIAELFLWDKMDKQSSYSTRSSVAGDVRKYEGRYQFPDAAVMVISSEGNELFAQLTGQPKFQIFPDKPDEFFWKVVEARIKFNKNEKGEVISGSFTQGGAAYDVPRIKDEPIIKVDPAVYKLYTGKYDFGTPNQLVVSTEGDRIFITATNQPKFEMFPVADKEFILKEITARITFVIDADGKINKLSLNLGGQKKDCPRIE